MRKTHFKIAHISGSIEVPIRSLFRYNGRLWVIHYIYGTEKYRCSDYLTGTCIEKADSWHHKLTKELAKKKIDEHKDFDFSKYTVINNP